MATIEVDVCDQCGKETKDYYNEIGWIEIGRFNEEISLSIARGRRKSGPAKSSGYYSGKPLQFCSTKCLVKYIDTLVENAKKQDAGE